MEILQKESQIPLEFKRIDINISSIKDAIGILEDRLSSVLTSPCPNNSEVKAINPCETVPLAADLKHITAELAEIASRIYQLKDRCEL